MIHDIELGAEFFFSEEDYLSKQKKKSQPEVKTEAPQLNVPRISIAGRASTTKSPSKRRPRRSAADPVRSYVVPDSDDEDIAAEDGGKAVKLYLGTRKKKVETNLQKWIKELSVLFKEEQRKVHPSLERVWLVSDTTFLQYKEKKKRVEKESTSPETKVRVTKVRNLPKYSSSECLYLYRAHFSSP